MLAITFYAGGVKIEGHAFFAPKGDDIVCAAISGIVLGGLNWYDPKDLSIQRSERNNIFSFELKNSDYDKLIALQVIQTQIEAIAKVYPNYIKIIDNSRKIII